MNRDLAVGIPLLILLTVLQASLLSRFPVLGVTPPLLFLFALAWGLLRGIEAGLIWAFIGGFLSDLFSASPMGTTFLAMGAAIFVVTQLQRGLPVNRVLVPLLLALIGAPIYLLVSSLLLRMIGFLPGWQHLSAFPSTTLISVIGLLPIYWLLYGLERAIGPRRVDTAL